MTDGTAKPASKQPETDTPPVKPGDVTRALADVVKAQRDLLAQQKGTMAGHLQIKAAAVIERADALLGLIDRIEEDK